MADEKAFTLVEVLVATLVLSVMAGLSTYMYGTFLDIWHAKKLTDNGPFQAYRRQVLFRTALECASDYYVTDRASLGATARYYPFFKGKNDTLEFVTLCSVFHEGSPALARIGVREGPAGGKRNVVYEETALNRTYLRYGEEPPDYEDRLIVVEDVRAIRFRYYGELETVFVRDTMTFQTEYEWQNTFKGKEKFGLPERVELSIELEGGAPTTLLFPIRARNDFKRVRFNPQQG